MSNITYKDPKGIRLGGLYDGIRSRLPKNETYDRLRLLGTYTMETLQWYALPYDITTTIEWYCECGVRQTRETMEVPVRGGYARWPEYPLWKPKAQPRRIVVSSQ